MLSWLKFESQSATSQPPGLGWIRLLCFSTVPQPPALSINCLEPCLAHNILWVFVWSAFVLFFVTGDRTHLFKIRRAGCAKLSRLCWSSYLSLPECWGYGCLPPSPTEISTVYLDLNWPHNEVCLCWSFDLEFFKQQHREIFPSEIGMWPLLLV